MAPAQPIKMEKKEIIHLRTFYHMAKKVFLNNAFPLNFMLCLCLIFLFRVVDKWVRTIITLQYKKFKTSLKPKTDSLFLYSFHLYSWMATERMSAISFLIWILQTNLVLISRYESDERLINLKISPKEKKEPKEKKRLA